MTNEHTPDLLQALKAVARAKIRDYGPDGWSETRYCFCDMSLIDDQSQHTEECSLAVAAISKATVSHDAARATGER